MCRFLDAGNKEAPHAQLTGVQKAPRHEVAGFGHRPGSERYWDFSRRVLTYEASKSSGLECMHNLSDLARVLLIGGFNLLGPWNFKWLGVAEMAHSTTTARLIGRSVFSGIA